MLHSSFDVEQTVQTCVESKSDVLIGRETVFDTKLETIAELCFE